MPGQDQYHFPKRSYPPVVVVDRVVTSVTVGNTAAETPIYSKLIGASDLGVNKRLALKMPCTIVSTAVINQNLTFRLKYGATTLATIVIVCDDNIANTRFTSTSGAAIEATLQAFNATNVQHGLLEWRARLAGATTLITGDLQAMLATVFGTSAIDSTSAQTLLVSVQWSVADAGSSFIMKEAVLLLE